MKFRQMKQVFSIYSVGLWFSIVMVRAFAEWAEGLCVEELLEMIIIIKKQIIVNITLLIVTEYKRT